jgi:hypothetical protein
MVRALVVLACAIAAACGPRAAVPARISVVDPGAQPRVRLRFTPAVGVVQRVENQVKMRMVNRMTDTTLETKTRSGETPALRIVLRFETAELGPDGSARVVVFVEEAALLDQVVEPRLSGAVAQMVGKRFSFRRTPNGAITNVQGTPRDTTEELRRLFEATRTDLVLFPDEELGAGASWRVTSRHTIAGIEWERTVAYKLRSLEGRVATIDVDTTLRAAAQPVSVEPNATTRLKSGSGKVTGTLVVSLDGSAIVATYQEELALELAIVLHGLRIAASLSTAVEVKAELR